MFQKLNHMPGMQYLTSKNMLIDRFVKYIEDMRVNVKDPTCIVFETSLYTRIKHSSSRKLTASILKENARLFLHPLARRMTTNDTTHQVQIGCSRPTGIEVRVWVCCSGRAWGSWPPSTTTVSSAARLALVRWLRGTSTTPTSTNSTRLSFACTSTWPAPIRCSCTSTNDPSSKGTLTTTT